MFPVETLVPAYYEERAAADEAKRIARQQQQEAATKAQEAAVTKQAPRNMTQAIMQRPPLAHTNSNGFLGNIFQGFVKAASAAPSSNPSQAPTPSNKETAKNTTGVSATGVSAELEKVRAEQIRAEKERLRDADICTFPHYC